MDKHLHRDSPPKRLDDPVMDLVFSQPATDLLQNCDLPPPIKLFSGVHDSTIARSTCGIVHRSDEGDFAIEEDRVELLRALRLSQTRAREAEAKRAKIAREKDSLSAAFAEEAMRVFCYRNLVKTMEIEADKVRSGFEAEGGGGGAFPWLVAVAFCLGVVGVGVAFGCFLS